MKEREIEQEDCSHAYEKYLARHLGNGKWRIYYKCAKCGKVKNKVNKP